MVQAVITLNEKEDRVLNIVKGKFGLKNKSEAVNLIIRDYEQELLEPELRPEFIEEMKEIEKEPTIKIGSIKDFEKRYELNWMYQIEITKKLDEIFLKLSKNNPKQIYIIKNKINEIIQNPQHYKNLRKPIQHLKEVHIDKSFVLVFSVDESKKVVIFKNFKHKDEIYKNPF